MTISLSVTEKTSRERRRSHCLGRRCAALCQVGWRPRAHHRAARATRVCGTHVDVCGGWTHGQSDRVGQRGNASVG